MNKSVLILGMVFTLLQFAVSSDKSRIAIYTLDARGGIPAALAANVTDLLQTELSRANCFEVLDRANLQRILKEQALQNSGCSDSSCAVKIGNLLNVQRMVVGSLFRLGDEIFVTMSFVNVELGRVEFSEKVSVKTESELPSAVDQLVKLIRSKTVVMARVIKVESETTVMVNLGSEDQLVKGQKLHFSRKGEALIDPQTGALLGQKNVDLGDGVVQEVLGVSVAQVSVPANMGFKEGDVVTLSTPQTAEPTVAVNAGPSKPPAPEQKPVVFQTREVDQRPTKKTLFITGISGAALGIGGIVSGVILGEAYTKAQSAYRNATNDFDGKFASAQALNTATSATLIGGYALGGVGVVMLGIALILPEKTLEKVPVGIRVQPDQFWIGYQRRF